MRVRTPACLCAGVERQVRQRRGDGVRLSALFLQLFLCKLG